MIFYMHNGTLSQIAGINPPVINFSGIIEKFWDDKVRGRRIMTAIWYPTALQPKNIFYGG